jgi:hypothetical protein
MDAKPSRMSYAKQVGSKTRPASHRLTQIFTVQILSSSLVTCLPRRSLDEGGQKTAHSANASNYFTTEDTKTTEKKRVVASDCRQSGSDFLSSCFPNSIFRPLVTRHWPLLLNRRTSCFFSSCDILWSQFDSTTVVGRIAVVAAVLGCACHLSPVTGHF